MAEIVRMPKLSDTMTEGVVAKWHKKVGDKVKSGELLADIETDKATMEFESFQDGVLLHIGVDAGKGAPIDSVLAILGKEGEEFKSLLEQEKKKVQVSSVRESIVTPPPPAKKETVSDTIKPAPQTAPRISNPQPVAAADGRLKASPLAKRLAEEKGISINRLQGSGEGGRVIKRDIEKHAHFGGLTPPFSGEEGFSEETVSQMRKTIARRLSESKFSAPHFYLTMEIGMDEAVKAREVINRVAPEKISYNDLVIKAVSLSLKRHPRVNSSWLGDTIRYNQHIHIGVAIAVEDGLLVPVVRFADGKTLSQISGEVKEFSKKAKEKKLQPADWEGNTFTISNLGMFGIEEFTAIINPPDACILAVGGIKEAPVVKNGQVIPGFTMKVTMSCDHRAVDGVTGASFLQTLKTYLENPVLLLGEQNI